VRKGAPWLKPVLVQCAWAASRKKNSYFEAQFLRRKARRDPNKAVVAVAASMLTGRFTTWSPTALATKSLAPTTSPAVIRAVRGQARKLDPQPWL